MNRLKGYMLFTLSCLSILLLSSCGNNNNDNSSTSESTDIQSPESISVDTVNNILSWNEVEGAESYNIYYKELDGDPSLYDIDSEDRIVDKSDNKINITDNSYSISNFNKCYTYYVYAISAVKGSKESSLFGGHSYYPGPNRCVRPVPDITPLEFYNEWKSKSSDILNNILITYGKSFEEFDINDYTNFMSNIDLYSDEGIMTWSIATGIPVIALEEWSTFYYYNTHLLADKAGSKMSYGEFSQLVSTYNQDTFQMEITNGEGLIQETTTLNEGMIKELRYITYEGIAVSNFEESISYELLAPYLMHINQLLRKDISDAIKSLPLKVVKVLRGKGIFLCNESAWSYTIASPTSNETYRYFAGLTPGFFYENSGKYTFVHEVGHLVDLTVIKRDYSNFYYSYQYPYYSSLREERNDIFEDMSGTDYGYISLYSMTNSNENFAEHFVHFILNNDDFIQQAKTEEQAGYPLLRLKYDFIQRVIYGTSPAYDFLSAD